jgi:hypothetical protein
MKKLTISVSDEFYFGLQHTVGRRRIGAFLENIVRPYVINEDLTMAYREMANDAAREEEAEEWIEAIVGDCTHEAR